MSRYARSEELLARALKVIPSGTQTFSKGHTQYPVGAAPLFLERGEGAHVIDVDGNRFLDYPLALGPNILGYGDPAVTEAVTARLRDGVSFSLPHRLEVEVAEMLVERIPCAEMVRFGKNGSDVTAAAVRLARAITGREHVAICGYHGWQDWYIATTTRRLGVPAAVQDLSHTFEYNRLETLEALLERLPRGVAAVVLEAYGVVEPAPGFLEGVARLAREHGALLVFDEIVNGFRLAHGGAAERFGVQPDLACFGKAMANGLPLSALVGRRDLMARVDDIFFSFTAGGETAALAACQATLLELERREVYPHLWRLGDRLRDGLNEAAIAAGLGAHVRCIGPGPHTVVQFKDASGRDSLALRALFQQEAAARGVLFLVGHNICAALREQDVAHTLEAYRELLPILAGALDDPARALRGRVPQPIFRAP